jgi:putative peptidoglycan lipid II flippase
MGVVIGGFAHFAIQLPYVIHVGLLPRFTSTIDFNVLKDVFKVSVPRTIALSANMFELIVITSFASALAVGSISVFNLALNLQSVPFAIVGVSYALAAFPTLSAYFAKGEKEQFMNHMVTAARHVIFWSLPIASLFIVLRAQIVRTVLGSGDFNWDNTRLTAACLSLFVVSLVAQALELLFIRAYYAAGRTDKPLITNLASSLATIGLPLFFVHLFQNVPTFKFFMESLFKVEGIYGSDVIMLPLGYSIGTLINALAFWIMFEKDFGNFSKRTLPTLFTSIQAAIVGGFVSYIGLNIFDNVFDLNTLSGIFLQGFCAGIIGIVSIVGIFIILGNKEISEVWSAMKQKISREKIIVSEPDKIEV